MKLIDFFLSICNNQGIINNSRLKDRTIHSNNSWFLNKISDNNCRAEIISVSRNYFHILDSDTLYKNLIYIYNENESALNHIQISNFIYIFNYLLSNSNLLNDEKAISIINYILKNRKNSYIPFDKHLPLEITSYRSLILYDKKKEFTLPFDKNDIYNYWDQNKQTRKSKIKEEHLYMPIIDLLSDNNWHYFQDIMYEIASHTGKDELDNNNEIEDALSWALIFLSKSRIVDYDYKKKVKINENAGKLISDLKIKKLNNIDILKIICRYPYDVYFRKMKDKTINRNDF